MVNVRKFHLWSREDVLADNCSTYEENGAEAPEEDQPVVDMSSAAESQPEEKSSEVNDTPTNDDETVVELRNKTLASAPIVASNSPNPLRRSPRIAERHRAKK